MMIMILMILILFRILAWCNNFGKLKVLKQGISKELLPASNKMVGLALARK